MTSFLPPSRAEALTRKNPKTPVYPSFPAAGSRDITMADAVQYRLERMSDELDDLERRGLFTRAELAEVVRRRRDFEFRLRRRSPLRSDFLDYIAYELRLDALRDLRKRAIIRATPDTTDHDADATDNDSSKKKKKKKRNKGKAKKWKKSVSDIAGVLRVLDIYRMATVRYKGDLDLWFRYLEFCRDKRHGRMKQASLPRTFPPSCLILPITSFSILCMILRHCLVQSILLAFLHAALD